MKYFANLYSYRILAIAAISVIIGACSDKPSVDKSAASAEAAQNKQIPVEVMRANIGEAASYYVTTTTLSPSSDAQINARTAGIVKEILHEEGDDVEAGELLLILEDDDQKLRLKQAEQKLASAEREFNRLNKMKQAGVLSTTEWETTNNAFLTAKTDQQLAALALSYTRVTSPFKGRVVWREVDWGAYVASGDLLFRVMAIKPLLARIHVPANRIEKIAAGQAVELRVDSANRPVTGIIDLVSPIVDPATGTVKVTVRLDSYPKMVRPGDFAEVRMITNKRENAMLLPSGAIIEERGQHHLFIEEQGKAVRKKITIGYVIGDHTEILSGIDKDDRVVFKGQRNLNDGNPLNVIKTIVEQDITQEKSQTDVNAASAEKSNAVVKSNESSPL